MNPIRGGRLSFGLFYGGAPWCAAAVAPRWSIPARWLPSKDERDYR